jgi:hypothetical protein
LLEICELTTWKFNKPSLKFASPKNDQANKNRFLKDFPVMTIAIEQESSLRRKKDGVAANDDHVGYASGLVGKRDEHSTSESGGWDAYEVWRRLIKDARDRRAGGTLPQ